MKTLEPSARNGDRPDRIKGIQPNDAGSESRSSISSKRRSERVLPESRRWPRRSSWSLSRRVGSSPSSSDSPMV